MPTPEHSISAKSPIILAADIGGTNCRLGLFAFHGGGLALERQAWLASAEMGTGHDVARAAISSLGLSAQDVGLVAMAVAGPVAADSAQLTNGSLLVRGEELRHAFTKAKCMLLNDFCAQAFACLTCAGQGAGQVAGPAVADPNTAPHATRAVLGAGTGLGMASLCHTGQGWLALPSEAGHAPFPFVGKEEEDYHAFARQKLQTPFASCEQVLSGRGLALLHLHLTGQQIEPAQVGQQALSHASDTLAWYARFTARVCRGWMLSTLCAGGLWLCGGIAARNPLLVRSPHFAGELLAAGPMRDLVRSMPLRLMTDENSGLWGAARAALELAHAAGPSGRIC